MANLFERIDAQALKQPDNLFTRIDKEKLSNTAKNIASTQEVDIGQTAVTKPSTEDQISAGKFAAALGTEVVIGESGRMAGAAIAGPIGYVIGGLASGAYGSYVAQNITNPDDISPGRIIADSFINLIPGAKAAKGGRQIASSVARQGAVGAGIATGAEVVEEAVDERRLPTIEELSRAGLTGAALGGALGLTGEAFNKFYSKYAGLPARNIDAILKEKTGKGIEAKDVKQLQDTYDRLVKISRDSRTGFQESVDNIITNIKEKASDKNVRLYNLQQQSGGNQYINEKGQLKILGDESDPYLQRTLADTRINLKKKELNDLKDEYLNQLNVASKITQKSNNPRTETELDKDIQKYLYAKHAVDYNKHLKDGSAGITTREAKNIINSFERYKLNDLLGPAIKIQKQQSQDVLDILKDGGLVTQKTYNNLRERYPNYVPLNRIMDSEAYKTERQAIEAAKKLGISEPNIKRTLGGKFIVEGEPEEHIAPFFKAVNYTSEARETGIREAKGSDLAVDNINNNIENAKSLAIERAAYNKSNMAFVEALRNNPGQDIATIKKVKLNYKPTNKNILSVFEPEKINGKETGNLTRYAVDIKDDNLARTMRGLNKQDVGPMIEAASQLGRAYNRVLGGLYTRFNVDFIFANPFRDRTEAIANTIRTLGYKNAHKTINPKLAVRDSNVVRRKLFNPKASNNELAKSPEDLKMLERYDEFRQSGASVSGLGYTTRQDIETELKNMSKRLDSPARQKIASFTKWVDNVNGIFEDSTRFSVYNNARDQGLSKDKAAMLALNSSFNPLLGGTNMDLLKAVYLFGNPALQATKNVLRNLNPLGEKGKKFYEKTSTKFFATLLGLTTAVDFWNSSYDPQWREKLIGPTKSKWLNNKNIVIVTGENEDGTLSHFKMPIGYGITPFKVMADKTQQAVRGTEIGSPSENIKDIFEEMTDAYNPTGGSLIPTIARPWSELSTNKDGLGRAIRPDWMERENMSATEQIYPWTARTQGGEVAMALADTVKDVYGKEVSPANILYLFRTWVGGPGVTIERIANVVSKLYNNEKVEAADVPVLRKFIGEDFGKKYEDRRGQILDIETIEKEAGTESARTSRIAYDIFQKIDKANPSERQSIFLKEISENEFATQPVIRKVLEKIKNKAMGLTPAEVRIRRLPIKQRTKALIEEMKLKSRPEIEQYIVDMKNKKVLTKSVEEELGKSEEFINIFLRQTR